MILKLIKIHKKRISIKTKKNDIKSNNMHIEVILLKKNDIDLI